MKVVLTIPDDVVTVEVYAKSKDDAITHSRIFEGGSITNSRFIDKEETMGMRYTEGLEKRIDLLEIAMPSGGKNVDIALEALFGRVGRLEERFDKSEKQIEAHAKSIASTGEDVDRWYDENRRIEEQVGGLRRTVDSLDKWTDATDGQLKSIERRLADLERVRLASETVQFEKGKDFKDAPGFVFNGEEKPCIIVEGLDAEALKKALNDPKMKTIPDGALENRGPYTDILRRLTQLEESMKSAQEKVDDNTGNVCALKSDKKDIIAQLQDRSKRISKLEERANVARSDIQRIFGYKVDIGSRIGTIEKVLGKYKDGNIPFPFLPTVKDYAEMKQRIDALETQSKVSRPTWDNFSLHDQRICKLESRMEDAEKKAAVAESVRKQLAEDIKGLQGRINKICEETCVDA